MKSKKHGSLPWALPPLLPLVHRADVSKTLFGQNFLSITLDEAHNIRNYGAKHSAALAILDRSVIRLILTATPLQTGTKVCAPVFLTILHASNDTIIGSGRNGPLNGNTALPH